MPQRVCVVGNGPLTPAERREINASCEVVYRFNDLKNWETSDRVDVHVQREWEGTHKYAGEGMAPCAQALLVGIHASQDAGQKGAMALPTRGLRAYDVFGTCKPHNPVSRNPSTGSILLSELQADQSVSGIDVYGMNWSFSKQQGHSMQEGDLVDACCTKCKIHRTSRSTYV